jgi:DNA-binding transcriptional ArsR family regulator
MFKALDPLLHSQLRLAVMSLLIGVEEADFVFLKEKTGATSGNLSVQIDKLNEAGYITVTKMFKGKMPCTICKITETGISAFENYVKALQGYINKDSVNQTEL